MCFYKTKAQKMAFFQSNIGYFFWIIFKSFALKMILCNSKTESSAEQTKCYWEGTVLKLEAMTF